nr:choice-of-anchor D domain-containing protein [Cyanobacteriota bacterium]
MISGGAGTEVALRAAFGIGANGASDIDTSVDTLAAVTTNTNDIAVSNTGALEIGTVDGLVGVDAADEVFISTASPLTVAANVTGAGAVTLTSTDAAGPGDDLTINGGGVTVESTGANVVLNSGDDFTLSLGGTVRAATTIDINVDPITNAAGATVDLLGNVDATQTNVNGGGDADIFNILPTSTSPITVNGGAPVLPGPGDVLNMDFSGLTNSPFLTLGAAAGSGAFGFVAPDIEQTVNYTSIENVTSAGAYHLVLDMFASGFQNGGADVIDAFLDVPGTNLILDINGPNFFTGAIADILSFTVVGSTDDETLNVNETAGGLPFFTEAAPVAVPGSAGSHLNAAANFFLDNTFGGAAPFTVDDITIHYDGGLGTDNINVNFTTDHNAAYFSDTDDGLGSGNIAAATTAGVDIDLGLSFAGLEGVGINGTTTGGGLHVDASSTPGTDNIQINDVGGAGDGVSQIIANGGFTNMVFSGFNDLEVLGGSGSELIDLIALDSTTTLTQIQLDADDVFGTNAADVDTIRVRSTPAGVLTDVFILAADGDDLIQIFDAGNTVDNINAAITVDGEGGTDTLTVIDSGDATADTFEVTSTTVEGLTSAAGTDVTFADIDNLNVTGTGGNDIINVNLGAQLDLNNVTINGFNGDDDFNLQNSTPVGVDTRLNGDAGLDDFIFLASNVLRGFINGGGDRDTIDYSGYAPVVHVALSGLGPIDGFEGRENNGSILGTGIASLGFTNIDNLLGTAGVDTLEGPDLNNYWGITSNDAGRLIADRTNLLIGRPTTGADTTATPPEQLIDFTSFQNLIGGAMDDRFDLSNGVGLTGTLDGRGGNDSLDYRDYVGGVTVDLFAGTATNIGAGLLGGLGGGDDDNSIENVFGGDGNDNIVGDNDDNILGDGFGDDFLDGGGNGVGSGNGGNDVFLMEPGNGGSTDVITDIHGNDTIDFRFASAGITFDVDIINTPQDVFGGNTVELRQIQPQQPDTNPSFMENIVGSEFADLIFIDPLSQDGNFPIDGPPVLRSADGRGGVDILDFDAKGQEVIDTGFSLTADGVGTVQYLNFENVRPFEDNPGFIVDNGDPGFSISGDWRFHPHGTASITNGTGFEDDIHSVPKMFSPGGHDLAEAFWEFYGLTPGDYRVSVTWPVSTNPGATAMVATDTPFTIFDGARTNIGTPAEVNLGTVDLNQQVDPDDFSSNGVVWEVLGTVSISSRTLTVMLSNLANGTVIADAIRLDRVSAGPEVELTDVTDMLAPPALVVDGQPGGVNFGSTELLTPAVRSFVLANNGSATLNISNVVIPPGFTVMGLPASIGAGSSAMFTIEMDASTFGDRSGIFSFDTDDVDEATFNILLQGSVSNVVVIDDGDADFMATGGFESYTGVFNEGIRGFEGDVSGAIPNQTGVTPAPATETATWTFTDLADGNYRVSTTWSPFYNRVEDAPYTLDGGGGVGAPIDVDQRVFPSSFTEDGTAWFDLDTSFAVVGGVLTVSLTNDASNYVRDHYDLLNSKGVIADAVRIEYLPEPDIQVTVDGGTIVPDDTGLVDFGSTLPGIPEIKTFRIENLSTDPVDVQGLIEFPPGFSIDPTSPFGTVASPPAPAVSIPGGGFVEFIIQFDGGTNGSTFGQISFTTGDEDANPYNFTVTGTAGSATVEVTDPNPEFSTTGTWAGHTPRNVGDPEFLYAGDYNTGGTGANAATWEFDVEPGRYQVVAHWYVHPDITTYGRGAASNAPYTIFDNGALVTTVRVSHQEQSNDFLDDGILWEYIGDPVDISTDTMTVQLTDDANGIVYADEIRIYRVVDPVIKVEVDGGSIDDGGVVDFEETIVGAPVTKVFTVTNFGERNMALGPVVVPAGFTLVTPPGNNNLAPGASTTFTLQMLAGGAGSPSGMVMFGVDSQDANPFNFTVSGVIQDSMIVDNGDLGYSTSGTWETREATSLFRYFQGDTDRLPGDEPGVNTASWTFTDLPAGTYQVASTWSAHSNQAPNAGFTVTGIEGGPINGTVDQRFAPNDFNADGADWEELGFFQVAAGGSLTVTLADTGANGVVLADAVRLEIIPVGLLDPEIDVEIGGTGLTSGVGTVDFGTAFFGESVFQTVTVTNSGTDTLNLGAIVTPAGFNVSTPPGDSTLAAGQSTTFVLEFNSTGTPGAFGGPVTIPSNDGDENPFIINVSGVMTASVIIDDGDAGFSSSGDFFNNGGPFYFGYDSQRLNIGGTGTSTWDFSALPAGTYQVSTTWNSHVISRDTDVQYNVTSSGSGGGVANVNQRITPSSFNADGASWQILGTVNILAGGTITVTLTDTATDGLILADAVRIERTGPLVAAGGVSSTVAPSITQADLNSVLDTALSYWEAAGVSEEQLSLLQSVNFVLTDLPDATLGAA